MFLDSRKKRRRRKRITAIGICFIILGMAMYGYNVSREEVRQQQLQADLTSMTPMPTLATPNVPVIKPNDPVIEERAEMILTTHYLGCGHDIERALDSENFVGLTQKQLQALYPLYTITSFSSTRVEMRREVEGVCPNHFMVKLEDTKLVIYQRSEDDTWREVQTIEDFYIPYEDETLKEGVIFDDMHQVESFLENYDS